jgi:hypothetical protein
LLAAGGAINHVLLALAVAGLLGAAWRLASLAAPAGLERVVAAAPLAVAAAVAQALLLGLVGLGASPVGLSLAAGLTWLAAARLLPPAATPAREELRGWWRALDRRLRYAAAALAGAGAATALWQLLNPSIGFDSSVYHFAEVAGWIHNGRPGSILKLGLDLPYGNYPLTDEVALTWSAGIARSWVPLSLWSWAMWLLLGAGLLVTMRNLGAPRLPAVLGAATLLAHPLVVRQLNEPQNDVPALAWLACTTALCAGAPRRPALLAPAVVAAGLALGTKTTPLVLIAAALAAGAWSARAHLPRLTRPLLAAVLAALAAGGVWYGRNLVQHGHPLWPFASAPWGDPRPHFLTLVDTTLLERPAETIRVYAEKYAENLAGGIVLLAAAPLALLWALTGSALPRSAARRLALVAGLAAAATLVFAAAPGTGLQVHTEVWFGPTSTLRYALPAVGAAIVALSLAARERGAAGQVATLAIAAALAWNLVEDVLLGAPYLPPAWVVALGVVAGALALAAASLVRAPRLRAPAWAAAVAVAVLAGLALTPAGQGYIERHGDVDRSSAFGSSLAGWFARAPGWDEGEERTGFSSRAVIAALAGDHFEHPLELLPARAPCPHVRELAREGAVVATPPSFLYAFIGVVAPRTGRCLRGVRPAHRQYPFTVYRGR